MCGLIYTRLITLPSRTGGQGLGFGLLGVGAVIDKAVTDHQHNALLDNSANRQPPQT